MKKHFPLFSLFIFSFLACFSQERPATSTAPIQLDFVSDTQQPMLVEKIFLKPNHNLRATADIFSSILAAKPAQLYMLGDVVGLGSSNQKWKKVDAFLNSCRSNGTAVCGLLGNHEVLFRKKKGMQNFDKRFPMNVHTGYVSVTDSVAVVMLNSNFKSLSENDLLKQRTWYRETMIGLDAADSIKDIIVCCHHAPYTNSKVVGPNLKVQEYFVQEYIGSKKAKLFITGHAHAFEHFNMHGKDFFVIGGGGGLHQPLNASQTELKDFASTYKPMFHYLSVNRIGDNLFVTSHFLKNDFSGFDNGYSYSTLSQSSNLATTQKPASAKKGTE